MVQLDEFWKSHLSRLPETGMGYQKVDILLRDGHTIKNVTVFNGEECETNQEFKPADIADIQLHTE